MIEATELLTTGLYGKREPALREAAFLALRAAALTDVCERIVRLSDEHGAILDSRHTIEDEERTDPQLTATNGAIEQAMQCIEALDKPSTPAALLAMSRAAVSLIIRKVDGTVNYEDSPNAIWLALLCVETMAADATLSAAASGSGDCRPAKESSDPVIALCLYWRAIENACLSATASASETRRDLVAIHGEPSDQNLGALLRAKGDSAGNRRLIHANRKSDRLNARSCDLAEKIFEAEATSLQGVLVKLSTFVEFYNRVDLSPLEETAFAVIGNAISVIESLAQVPDEGVSAARRATTGTRSSVPFGAGRGVGRVKVS